jgi:uncharacterized protein YhbP (UPF0306 family)
MSKADRDLIRDVISKGRYLVLSTTDGTEPWAAPLEYLHDEQLNFYFLSTNDSRHAQHIGTNPAVALAIFDVAQPAYSPALTAPLRGVQISGSAAALSPDEHPESVDAAIAVLKPPMPPYRVFKVTPSLFYLPKVVNGVNQRVEVQIARDPKVSLHHTPSRSM